MEPTANEMQILEEKCLDPFDNALIEDLRDLMFQHLTGSEVKRIYQVSPLWNEIASASKKCGDKLRLTIDDKGNSIKDKLQVISKMGASTDRFGLNQSQDAHNKIVTTNRRWTQINFERFAYLRFDKDICRDGFAKVIAQSRRFFAWQMVDNNQTAGVLLLLLPKLKKPNA
jgi:hypothetical protein